MGPAASEVERRALGVAGVPVFRKRVAAKNSGAVLTGDATKNREGISVASKKGRGRPRKKEALSSTERARRRRAALLALRIAEAK
jgi:hypothetical protein